MNWLSPPPYSDEESARVARAVHIISLGIIAAVVPAAFHNWWVHHYWSAFVLACGAIAATACVVLSRRGALWLAARLLAFGCIVFAAALQFVGGRGVHDIVVLVYPCAIIVAGALFGRRWFVFYVVVTMATFAGQYSLEVLGVLWYPQTPYTDVRFLFDGEVIFALTGLGIGLLMDSLRRSMARSREAIVSLRESEDLYRSLFESVSEAVVVHDPHDSHIVDANLRASEWFGYSVHEMRGLLPSDLSAMEPAYSQENALARFRLTLAGQPQFFEWLARSRDGRLFWVEVNMHAAMVGGVKRILVSMRDVDERKRAETEKNRLEEQLRQAQKLESIGRLAGGVAHDFNNLLTCIIGNTDLVANALPATHLCRQSLDEINHAAKRAAELTGQLLAFSRKQPIVPLPIGLPDLMMSVERMLRRLLGESIQVETDVVKGVGIIRADPGQIEQILVNLAVNARDAMPESGRLLITAENATIDNGFCAVNAGAYPGEFVRIGVSDTGVGMSDEVRKHIFEPFFTTKPQGKGTGLGLAMVFGAVQQNKGFIVVRSENGKGSTFDLYFPRWEGEAQSLATGPISSSLPRGRERVLLVEDDASVRVLAKRILSQLGYHVVSCGTGAEAIDAVRSSDNFDMLLADVILPDTNGRALALRLQEERPRLRVLYCSGYTEDVIAHHGVVEEGLTFLPKPFTAEDLARKVRACLDQRAAG